MFHFYLTCFNRSGTSPSFVEQFKKEGPYGPGRNSFGSAFLLCFPLPGGIPGKGTVHGPDLRCPAAGLRPGFPDAPAGVRVFFCLRPGVQLDALGASAGIPRQEGWEDETYRRVLLRKPRIWSWDGTNETAGEFLLPGETLKDNGNNSVTVSAGLLPLPAEELLPVPLGVNVIRLD